MSGPCTCSLCLHSLFCQCPAHVPVYSVCIACFVSVRPVYLFVCIACFVSVRPVYLFVCIACFVSVRPVYLFVCIACFVSVRPVYLFAPSLQNQTHRPARENDSGNDVTCLSTCGDSGGGWRGQKVTLTTCTRPGR